MAYFLFLLVGLAIFWSLLSGLWDHGLLWGLGAASVLLVAWFGMRMEQTERRDYRLSILLRLPAYWAWLTLEIIKANLDVVKRIWSPGRHPISPTLARVPASQRTQLGRAIHANSITLTPGTVAIEVGDDDILVHGLTREGIDDLAAGDMDRRVTRTEGKPR